MAASDNTCVRAAKTQVAGLSLWFKQFGENGMKRICIVGAGAIGGFIGARLSLSAQTGLNPDIEVSALARGATLNALNTHGWRLREGSNLRAARTIASDRPSDLGMQDLVIIAVKAPALPQLAPTLKPLIGPHTTIMAAMNGVPWWFMNRGGQIGMPLQSVDPDGAISKVIPAEQVVGCVVHASTFTPEPGLVQVKMGNGLIVGEIDSGEIDATTKKLDGKAAVIANLLQRAGFDTNLSHRIRYDIWYKLWGNMTINPISALTGALSDQILDDPLVLNFVSACMLEASAVGKEIGCAIDQTPQDRHAITRKLGGFKTSMLQDVEANRAIELDALVGVVREIAERVKVATPNLDILFGMTRLFGRVRKIY